MAAKEDLAELMRGVSIPEAWYISPEGWMQKPDFKRKEQTPGHQGKSGGFLSKFKKNNFQWRWWILDGHTLRYYRDQNSAKESGWIDLNKIESVTLSQISDAPPNSIDLNAPDRIYTMACDTQEEVVRWATVFSKILSGAYDPVNPGVRESEDNDAAAGEEFSVTFDKKESLFMSLEGLSTYTIIVTGFVKRPDGTMGQAEGSGQIKEEDYLIGVNGVDLMKLTFFDSVAEIQNAEWPMALLFRRTVESKEDVLHKAWVLMKEPTGDKFYRRFLQLHDTNLEFFKPAYGGRQADHAGVIQLSEVAKVTQVLDKRATEKLQVQVSLVMTDGAEWMMCVKDEDDMRQWISHFSSHSVACDPLVLFEASMEEALASATHSGILHKQSDMNRASFQQRFFLLKGSSLQFHRDASSRQLGAIDLRDVTSVQPLKVEGCSRGYEYRLRIETQPAGGGAPHTFNLATAEEANIAAWQERIESVLQTLGGQATVAALVTEQADPEEQGTGGDEDDDPHEDVDVDAPDADDAVNGFGATAGRARKVTGFATFESSMQKVQGWLYKKGDVSKVTGLRNAAFKKRYFVLQQAELCYYKTRAQSLEGTPTGIIPLRRVQTVRASNTSWAENGIDLVTAKRTYTLVCEDEESFALWMDALLEAVDMLEGTRAQTPRCPRTKTVRRSASARRSSSRWPRGVT